MCCCWGKHKRKPQKSKTRRKRDWNLKEIFLFHIMQSVEIYKLLCWEGIRIFMPTRVCILSCFRISQPFNWINVTNQFEMDCWMILKIDVLLACVLMWKYKRDCEIDVYGNDSLRLGGNVFRIFHIILLYSLWSASTAKRRERFHFRFICFNLNRSISTTASSLALTRIWKCNKTFKLTLPSSWRRHNSE